MSTIKENTASKYRTTFYLTKENKAMLDQIPRGKKTVLVNEALSVMLKKIKKRENNKKFVEMIKGIEPVETQYSSEQIIRMIRNNKPGNSG